MAEVHPKSIDQSRQAASNARGGHAQLGRDLRGVEACAEAKGE
jgi:hypothetical protein